MNNIVEIENLSKEYRRGNEIIKALDGISLNIQFSDFVSITGSSGSGKTTLLQILGCMDVPTQGRYFLLNENALKTKDFELSNLRSKALGFVFQQFLLLPTLTALENVQMPSMFAKKKDSKERALALLHLVGLDSRLDHYPNELSGGEMQRVAIARALINDPKLLLADEPTGNLDSKNAETILNIFQKLNEGGLTIIMVTHNQELALKSKRQITMKDGKILI